MTKESKPPISTPDIYWGRVFVPDKEGNIFPSVTRIVEILGGDESGTLPDGSNIYDYLEELGNRNMGDSHTRKTINLELLETSFSKDDIKRVRDYCFGIENIPAEEVEHWHTRTEIASNRVVGTRHSPSTGIRGEGRYSSANDQAREKQSNLGDNKYIDRKKGGNSKRGGKIRTWY